MKIHMAISVILVFWHFVKISNSICLTPCGNEKESDIITIMTVGLEFDASQQRQLSVYCTRQVVSIIL